MKIQLFAIVLVLKAFLLSQNGVEAGPTFCKTNADCYIGSSCADSSGFQMCIPDWVLKQNAEKKN